MNRKHSWVLMGILAFQAYSQSFVETAMAVPGSVDVSTAMSPMPAVRRLGVLPVRTNLPAFREFMRNETRNMTGFLSLPFTESQASREISQMVSRGVIQSGRFWSLSLDALVELTGVSAQSTRDYTAAELRLYKTYDLDAWVDTEIVFNPDHTRLRLSLRSARDRGFVLAREDILFEAMPTSGELEKSVHNALTRVAATLSHDGRVTWRKNDLLVVDFGKERGLAQGSQLGAGYVILSARHPVSKEFLRAQKIQTLELEVVEAREGSSVCRILRRHALLENEANNLVPGIGEKGLLAWRKDVGDKSGWLEFSPAKNTDAGIVSGAEAGFAQDEKSASKQQPSAPDITPAPVPKEQNVVSKTDSTKDSSDKKDMDSAEPLPTSKPEATSDSEKSTPIVAPKQEKISDDESGNSDKSSINFEGMLDFKNWKPVDATFGLALAGGSLDAKLGARDTDFPSTMLNSIRASATIKYSPQIYVEPEMFYHFFSGTVDGSRFEIALPFSYVTMGNAEKPGSGALSLGLGPVALMGEVKSVRTVNAKILTTTQSFSSVDLAIQAMYALELPYVGETRAKAIVAVAEVLQGEGSATELRVQIRPSQYLPKELSFYSGYRMGPGIWSGYDVGAAWTLKL